MDQFEWDARKAARNRRKHGIDFADATAVFEDERALTVRDEITAVDEIRMLTLGRARWGGCWWWPTPGVVSGSG